MSDDDGRVTGGDWEWTLIKGCWDSDSERSAAREEEEREQKEEEEAVDSCELAPHSAMSVGAGRVDSPSPQDIRLLQDLVEDLSKEQDEKPRAEQVSHALPSGSRASERSREIGAYRASTSRATFAIGVR